MLWAPHSISPMRVLLHYFNHLYIGIRRWQNDNITYSLRGVRTEARPTIYAVHTLALAGITIAAASCAFEAVVTVASEWM